VNRAVHARIARIKSRVLFGSIALKAVLPPPSRGFGMITSSEVG
jgi:hypothetical protein